MRERASFEISLPYFVKFGTTLLCDKKEITQINTSFIKSEADPERE